VLARLTRPVHPGRAHGDEDGESTGIESRTTRGIDIDDATDLAKQPLTTATRRALRRRWRPAEHADQGNARVSPWRDDVMKA